MQEELHKQGILKDPDKTFELVVGNRQIADEVAYATSTDPAVGQAMRGAIFDLYQQKVIKNGVVNAQAHDAFMRKYGEAIKPFLGAGDQAQLAQLPRLEAAVEAARKADIQEQVRIDEAFGGKFAGMDPGQVFRQIWGPDNIGEIRKFRALARPETIQKMQAAVLEDLDRAMGIRAGQDVIESFTRLDKYLHGSGAGMGGGHAKALDELFKGTSFVSDLSTLHQVMKTAQSQAAHPNFPNTSYVNRSAMNQFVLALIARPLSKVGNVIRKTMGIGAEQAEKAFGNAILGGPDALHQLIQLRYLRPGSKRAAVIIGGLLGMEAGQTVREGVQSYGRQ